MESAVIKTLFTNPVALFLAWPVIAVAILIGGFALIGAVTVARILFNT
jgi:hypothetical protein